MFLQAHSLVDGIQAAIDNAGVLPARETGLNTVTAVCKEFGAPAHPYVAQLLPSILNAYADKVLSSQPCRGWLLPEGRIKYLSSWCGQDTFE